MTFSKLSALFCTILQLALLGRTDSTTTSKSNCITVSDTPAQHLVYIGWPHKISCGLLVESIPNSVDIDKLEVHPIECLIKRGNKTVYETTNVTYKNLDRPDTMPFYLTQDLKEGDETNYSVQLQSPKAGMCINMTIYLNLTHFQETTCEEFLQSNSTNKLKIPTAASFGNAWWLHCKADVAMRPYVDVTKNMTYEWLRNCSKESFNQTTFHSNGKDVAKTDAITFEDAGYYTCSIEYKGMKRYIELLRICVYNLLTYNEATLKCSESVLYRNVGEDAVFECKGDLGEGRIEPGHAKLKWEKLYDNGARGDKELCESRMREPNKAKHNETHISCDYGDTSNRENTCFHYVASPLERKISKARLNVHFRIRNIKKEDFGKYRITLTTQYEDSMPINSILTVERRLKPETWIIFTCMIVVLLLILVIFIMIYNRLYVKVYYKRYFGFYEVDNKPYGAFLAYNFSSYDLDEFAQDDIKSAVLSISQLLQGMGFSVFDEKKHGFISQSKADNIQHAVESSHRIVLILTSEFIKDGWSILALQKGFDEMIQSGSKLIFILLPGIQEYLNQHSEHDDTCRMIKRAMKLNHAITWSKKDVGLKRFKLVIEDAMPKLRRKAQHVEIKETNSGNPNFI